MVFMQNPHYMYEIMIKSWNQKRNKTRILIIRNQVLKAKSEKKWILKKIKKNNLSKPISMVMKYLEMGQNFSTLKKN
jgi:hypothetical protein